MRTKPSVIFRINVSLVFFLVGVSIITTAFFALVNSDFLTNAISVTLRDYSEALAFQIAAHPEADDLRRVAQDNNVTVFLTGADGTRGFDHTGSPASNGVLTSEIHGWERIDISTSEGKYITFLWDLSRFSEGHFPFLVGLLLLLGTIAGMTYWFQRSQLKPLHGLRAGVEAVRKGDLKVRVPIVRNDEIGEVATAFNEMTDDIEQMLSDHEQLLADVSHELNSPISRIKVGLEFLPEGPKRESISRNVLEMEELISMLLEREQLRVRTKRLERTQLSLSKLAREVVSSFENAIPKVIYDCSDSDIQVHADRTLIRVVVKNLIDNAVKFSKPDSDPIIVELKENADSISICVHDSGKGIAEVDCERVFEPFVKLDRSRGHRMGFGLGLDLCRRIINAHQGTIRIQPGKRVGASAIVELPA